jgi:hypothetical protein
MSRRPAVLAILMLAAVARVWGDSCPCIVAPGAYWLQRPHLVEGVVESIRWVPDPEGTTELEAVKKLQETRLRVTAGWKGPEERFLTVLSGGCLRVPFQRGEKWLVAADQKPGGATTDYCWAVKASEADSVRAELGPPRWVPRQE